MVQKKKNYEPATIEVVEFDADDIITTSGGMSMGES